MKTVLRSALAAVLIAAAIQLFTVGALAPNLPRKVVPPGVQELRTQVLPKARLVHVSNADGALTVATHDRDEIEVQANIRIYTQSWDPERVAQKYAATLIRTDRIGDTATIITEPEERPDEIDLLVDYTLLVPEGTDIGAVCMNGNVRVGAGCGRVRIMGNYTDIDITDPRGAVLAKSVTGRINVVNAAADTVLETVNGRIYASMMGGTLEASTTTGSIYTTLLDPSVQACDLTVLMGDITLVLSEGCSAQVDATTGRGVVTFELPPETLEGVYRRRELHGTLGPGQTKLTMNALNGNILLTRSAT